MLLYNVRRDGATAVYSADVLSRGATVARVVKRRGGIDYKAYADGLLVARGRTLDELRADLREWLATTPIG